MAEVKVAILGLERTGASFGLALKRYMQGKEARHTFTIVGHDERDYNVKHARSAGAIDSSARGPVEAVAGAHIVILAEHYYRVEKLYQAVGPALNPGTVILDFSPLKRPSIRWAAETLPADAEAAAYLVGVTPILNPDVLFEANSEVEAARADLFDGGTFIVTPAADCPAEAVDLAAEVARIVGADVHFMDPDEHDGLIAAMEGLPAALSLALFQTLIRSSGWSDLRRLANPAFGLQTSLLRYQHPDSLWALLQYNRENTARHLSALIDNLTAIRDGLREDAEGLGLEALLADAASRYEEWEGQRRANRWEKKGDEESVTTASVLGTMGGMLFGRRPRKDSDEPGKKKL
ncbi:MAG: prephenate dehydrogenase [Anaerolineae bacterium]|nr:prephenate dehydrogenase [Anaerolineae bacterium]